MLGALTGLMLGVRLGPRLGPFEGDRLGIELGLPKGDMLGVATGFKLGTDDGLLVGSALGMRDTDGYVVGSSDGATSWCSPPPHAQQASFTFLPSSPTRVTYRSHQCGAFVKVLQGNGPCPPVSQPASSTHTEGMVLGTLLGPTVADGTLLGATAV